MIRAPGKPDAPVPRLLDRLATGAAVGPDTLVLSSGSVERPESLDALFSRDRARVLVLSALGAHPDARAERLRTLWQIEERARRFRREVLTLRLGPIVGAGSPLWLKLCSQPRLGPDAETLFSPVLEDDVIETLARALDGRAVWEGWYAISGPEVLTLGEAVSLAARSGPLPHGAGSWEPPLAEIREHRMVETVPWSEHFGVTPRTITDHAGAWS